MEERRRDTRRRKIRNRSRKRGVGEIMREGDREWQTKGEREIEKEKENSEGEREK